MLAKKTQNISNQLDSLKDTNSRLIDYVKSINKKVGTANSGKEFSEIIENNKSRKIKEFKSKGETALWFAESYGLLESTDGQTVKVDFNPSSSKSSYQDLSEEERQKNKDLLFILEKYNVIESAYRELTASCDRLPRNIWFHQCQEDINSLYHFERILGNIPGAYVSLESETIRYFKYHVNSDGW